MIKSHVALRDALGLPSRNARIAPNTAVTASAREKGVRNAHRAPPGFVLLMGAADDAHFQDVIKVLVTSISVQPTGAENAAKKKDATSRQSADRISARDTAVENDARCRDATSRRNRPRNFASSMVGGKSANRRSARRLLGEGLYFVLRMGVVSDVS